LVAAAERAWLKLQLTGPLPNPWYYPRLGEYAALLEKHGLDVTYGMLFERPTPLEEGESGLGNWLKMFGGPIFTSLTERARDELIAETMREARADLFHEGEWMIDYRRLRVVAKRI
jgi:hypothetical protein